ncbi:hypothetical protein B5S28_g3993 [[Candida] boidinii]|nr:hypothetical protein B5S28_g3993 [[Candida] boidinii]
MGNLQNYIDEYLQRTNSTEDSLPEFIKVPNIYPDYTNLQWDSSSSSNIPSIPRPQHPTSLSAKIPTQPENNASKIDRKDTSNPDSIDPSKMSSGKYKLYFQSLNVRNSMINSNDDSLNSRYYKSHKVYSPNLDLVRDTHKIRKELSINKKNTNTTKSENSNKNISHENYNNNESTGILGTGFNYSKSNDESIKQNDTIEDPLTQFDNLISYPNVFCSNNIPPLFHHCSTNLLGYQFIFGGLTLLSYEEYEEYLRLITDDFTIPLENIEIRLAQDIIPLPIDRNIITSLAIKPNRTVYRYSTDSNTLLPVIDYESQAAAAAATAAAASSAASGYSTHSASSSTTATGAPGAKNLHAKRNMSASSNSVSSASTNSYRSIIPSQLVCATSSAASERHAIVYGGFDIETEIIRQGNKIIIEKRLTVSNSMRLFDAISLKFRELNIIVHPSVSAKLPQAIPRFGHVQTGLTIEENNADYLESFNKANSLLSTSNSNSNGKKTPLQQQQSTGQSVQPPPLTSFTSGDDVLLKYTRPASIFIGFGYKSTHSGKSFIAMNDMWRCEICVNQALSKANVNKLEFSENVICYPVGNFDIQKNHFKYTYDSNGDLIDDSSDDGIDEFTGCYKADEESNWPGGRAFCGYELIDNSTLYNTNINNHSNFSGSDSNARSIGSPLSDSSIALAQFQLKSQNQPQDTPTTSPKLHHPKPERLAANISNTDQFASLSRNKSVNSSNTTSTQTKSTSPFHRGTQQKQYYSSLFSDTTSTKTKPIPASSSPSTLISQSSFQKPTASQQHGYTSLLGATASPSSDISPSPISSPMNMSHISVSKEIFREKTLIIHGGSRIIHKRIKSKDVEGEYEISVRHEIFGDLWWFNLSSETWTKISTFADKSLFNNSEYQYESDIQRVSSIRSYDTNEDFPQQTDRELLDKQSYIPRNYSICGHNIIVDGKHLIVIGGSFAINYSDETFQYIKCSLNTTKTPDDVYEKTLQNDGFQKSKDANITEFVLKNQIKHLSKNKIFNTAFQTLILNLKSQIWREGTFFNSVGKNNVYHEYFKRTVGSIAYKDKSKIVVFGGWLTGIHNKDLDTIINEIRDSRDKYNKADEYDNTDISRIRSAASVISPHLQNYNDNESVATSHSSVFDVKDDDENINRLELVSNLVVEVYIPLMIV